MLSLKQLLRCGYRQKNRDLNFKILIYRNNKMGFEKYDITKKNADYRTIICSHLWALDLLY